LATPTPDSHNPGIIRGYTTDEKYVQVGVAEVEYVRVKSLDGTKTVLLTVVEVTFIFPEGVGDAWDLQ